MLFERTLGAVGSIKTNLVEYGSPSHRRIWILHQQFEYGTFCPCQPDFLAAYDCGEGIAVQSKVAESQSIGITVRLIFSKLYGYPCQQLGNVEGLCNIIARSRAMVGESGLETC